MVSRCNQALSITIFLFAKFPLQNYVTKFKIFITKLLLQNFCYKILLQNPSYKIWVAKGTLGFIHCLFKVASLATVNKQMPSSLAVYDALSLVYHKAWLYLFWVHLVDICTALKNSWYRRGSLHFLCSWKNWKLVNLIKVLEVSTKNKSTCKLDGVAPLMTDPPPISSTTLSPPPKKYVTLDTRHVTRDMWHVTRLGGWTFSQNFSSLALTICDLWYYEDLEEKAHLIS